MKQWVSNREIFSRSPLRRDALKIIEAGLLAIDTKTVMKEELKWDKNNRTLVIRDLALKFSDYKNIYVVAIGKCAVEASRVIEDTLGAEIMDGVVLDTSLGVSKRLRMRKGTHPFSSESNISATKEIVELLESATEEDLVLAVVSGGGSALLSSSFEMGQEVFSEITKNLMEGGATIEEINTVRKHLSKVKGGQLAKIAYPAAVVGLIFSDVNGDNFSVIASGPLTKDETTIAQAKEILKKYNLREYNLVETPKEDKYFEKTKTILVVNSSRALLAMEKEAKHLGYLAEIETSIMSGEAQSVGLELGERKLLSKSAILLAGETTVRAHNSTGEGGRNMELALGSLVGMKNKKIINKTVVALASDGRDNSDYAGAIADILSINTAKEVGLVPEKSLQMHDSKRFWEKCESQIITGETGINVADFVIMLTS